MVKAIWHPPGPKPTENILPEAVKILFDKYYEA